MKGNNSRYLFVHYLRGIAVLSVMFTHFGSAFFNSNPELSSYVNVPSIQDRIYPWVVLLMPVDFQGFLGVFGVTIFFLISGFVIPMSVEKYSLNEFLSKRFFRLFPTYFFVFSLNLLIALIGYSIYHSTGVDYQHGWRDVLVSYFMGLVLYFKGPNLLDPVAWTLAVE
ncbi:acyltransferase, partial [Cronobacter dublinensis]